MPPRLPSLERPPLTKKHLHFSSDKKRWRVGFALPEILRVRQGEAEARVTEAETTLP